MPAYDEATRRVLEVTYQRGLHLDEQSLRIVESLTPLSWKQIKQWMKTKRHKDKKAGIPIPTRDMAAKLDEQSEGLSRRKEYRLNATVTPGQKQILAIACDKGYLVAKTAGLIADMLDLDRKQVLNWGKQRRFKQRKQLMEDNLSPSPLMRSDYLNYYQPVRPQKQLEFLTYCHIPCANTRVSSTSGTNKSGIYPKISIAKMPETGSRLSSLFSDPDSSQWRDYDVRPTLPLSGSRMRWANTRPKIPRTKSKRTSLNIEVKSEFPSASVPVKRRKLEHHLEIPEIKTELPLLPEIGYGLKFEDFVNS